MEYIAADLPVEDFPEEPEGTSTYFRVPKTDVPDVMGLTQRKAEKEIFQAGLRAKIEKVASIEPKGEILGQSPRAGARVSQGSIVTVRISSGVPPILLDLRGMPVDQVDGALEAFNDESGLDLTWTRVDQETDDPAAVGTIIKTQPAPGAMVEIGQRIRVFVGVPAPPAEEAGGDG
jgi:serine/threonine-protein kinase